MQDAKSSSETGKLEIMLNIFTSQQSRMGRRMTFRIFPDNAVIYLLVPADSQPVLVEEVPCLQIRLRSEDSKWYLYEVDDAQCWSLAKDIGGFEDIEELFRCLHPDRLTGRL